MESINSSNYEVSVKDDKTFEKETETNQELDEAKEISFDGELSELLDAEKETGEEHGSDSEPIHGPADSKESNIEIDFGLLPEDKEKEYRGVLETVVKKVQFSLGMYASSFMFCWLSLGRHCSRRVTRLSSLLAAATTVVVLIGVFLRFISC